MTARWDPQQYLRFADLRERPFDELVARIGHHAPARIVDLGCGPGTATGRLLDRWPAAGVLGVDSSPEMIRRASSLAKPGRLDFVLGDVTSWAPDGPIDVIVSNALLQWVPGHADLLATFLGWLAPGGTLAFQVPANSDSPIHTELRRLAESGRWAHRLGGVQRDLTVLEPAGYMERLHAAGAQADVWETTYLQVLTGPDPVLEWSRGTALRPVLGVLDPEETAAFEAAYGAALHRAYPPDAEGRTLMPFRRIFAVAARPA